MLRSDLWAKLDRNEDGRVVRWHSLVDHSADVAAVLIALLEQPTISRRLATLAGRNSLDDTTRFRLGALAFLHDIGKANRGFRARIDLKADRIGHIDTLAWLFGPGSAAAPLHARLATVLGLNRLDTWFADEDAGLLQAVFAHHGRPWNRNAPDARCHWQPGPDGSPIDDLAPMRTALDGWFPDAFRSGCAHPANSGSPAYAGIDPALAFHPPPIAWLPRLRGDRPWGIGVFPV